MRYDRSKRVRSGRCATWGATAALYIRKRRLTTKAAAIVSRMGEPAATSWLTMSWAIPENDRTDSAIPSNALIPAATAATPVTKPNGMVPIKTGDTSRKPARNCCFWEEPKTLAATQEDSPQERAI